MTSPNAGRLADVDQLAAGRDDDHPRPRTDEHPIATDRGEQRDLLRAERGAGAERRRAGLQVLARAANALAAAHRPVQRHPGHAAVGAPRAGSPRRHRPGSARRS